MQSPSQAPIPHAPSWSSHGRATDASTHRVAPSRPEEAAAQAALPALGIGPGLLATALEQARLAGVTPAGWLIAAGRLDAEAYYEAIAHRLGLPFLRSPPRFEPGTATGEALRAGIAAILDARGAPAWLIAPAVENLPNSVLRWRFGRGAGQPVLLTTPSRFESWWLAAHGRGFARNVAGALARARPDLTAAGGVRPMQSALVVLTCLLVTLAALGASWFWPLVAPLAGTIFLAASLARLCAASMSMVSPSPDPPPLPDDRLPVYSVLIPLYREVRVLPRLLRALARLDYPRAKLDVRLIVEADDHETRQALARFDLPPWCRVLVAPPGEPRTKPRAMQIALPLVRGSLVTVYDAEDEPASDQLRRAAARFAHAPAAVACLQARLAIDNVDDGPWAALFALEYAALFDVVNPGLAALGWPMLLGGTSNHFRTEALRRVGGWDPWNVTEDADLGLRLARSGYRVEMLASTTDEEAPATASAWLAQRRRWLKGWMQTLLVHGAAGPRIVREIGPVRAAMTFGTLCGGVLGPLFGPLFLARTIYEMAAGRLLLPRGPLDALASTAVLFLLICGLGAMALPLALGMRRRGLADRWKVLWMLPAYHALMSVAAWRAVVDLLRHPFHWAKTEHGLARTSRRRAGTGG